jgi:hypothetical protein
MCVIVYLKTFVTIENVKIKILFDNEIEINCISKRLIDETELIVRHDIAMFMIIVIDDCAKFVNICDDLKVRLKNAHIIISIFVIEKSDHDLILRKFFERATRMSSVNMNDELLKLMIHFDDDDIKIFFLIVTINHSRNRKSDISFKIKSLNSRATF